MPGAVMARVRLRLRELAERKGLKLSHVQRQSGLDLGLVRRYWHNQTGRVSLNELGILAKLLKVKPGDLLTEVIEDEKG
jgi:transcriptional regulator with XRE-family HTH domain